MLNYSFTVLQPFEQYFSDVEPLDHWHIENCIHLTVN